MQTKNKSGIRRALSVLLSLVMILSCWVFTPIVAEAANQGGKYTVRLLFVAIDDFDMSDSNSYATITYKKNDGSGASATTSFNITNSVDGQKKYLTVAKLISVISPVMQVLQ